MSKISEEFNAVIEELMPTNGEWLNTFDEYRRVTRDTLDAGGNMRDILFACTDAYNEPQASQMRSAINDATDAEIEYAEARFLSIFETKN